jgi:hypothetical protein
MVELPTKKTNKITKKNRVNDDKIKTVFTPWAI